MTFSFTFTVTKEKIFAATAASLVPLAIYAIFIAPVA